MTQEKEGTTFGEICFISSNLSISHFLLVVILSCFPNIIKACFIWRFLVETGILLLPFISAISFLNSQNFFIPLIVQLLSFLILGQQKTTVSCKFTEILFFPKEPLKKNPIITNALSKIVLAVSICILAVDFKFFPPRLAKTKQYGISLMDIGVVLFIAINALMSPNARRIKFLNKYSYAKSIFRKNFLILLFGIVRLALIRYFNYHQDITEYGLHWNFFFTLALTKIFSTIITYFTQRYLIAATILIISHQISLSLGTSKYIMNPNRFGFLAANKEGILSLPGYIALYLFFVFIGSNYIHKWNKCINFQKIMVLSDLSSICLISIVVMITSDLYIEQISRRMMNLSFMASGVLFVCLLLMMEIFYELMKEILIYFDILKNFPQYSSKVIEAIANNSLLVFLFANIFTGIINISINTKSFNTFVSLLILYGYSLLICSFALMLVDVRVKRYFTSISLRKCL